MANKSEYLADAVINAVIRNISYTSTQVFVALYTGAPDPTGVDPTLNEVSTLGTGYSRKRIDDIMTAPSSGVTSNNVDIDFGVAAGNYGIVSHFALVNSAAGAGEILYSRNLTVAQTISTGNQPKFLQNALSVTES